MKKRCMLVVAALLAAASAQAQSSGPRAVPDWSGVWAMQGNTVFDHATVQRALASIAAVPCSPSPAPVPGAAVEPPACGAAAISASASGCGAGGLASGG